MKFSTCVQFAVFLLPGAITASISGRSYNSTSRCSFSISASEPFTGFVGQLDDGQIRLNGSYPKAIFYLDSAGGMTDSHGFGCIVTDVPITQVQCDQGKKPYDNFSISATGQLMYKGSPHFFACPANYEEYNVYIAPAFDQDKCVPITLQTSGCGGSSSSSSSGTCPVASTVWRTQQTTVTVTTTGSTLSTSSYTNSTSSSSTTSCTSSSKWGISTTMSITTY